MKDKRENCSGWQM